MFPCEDVLPPFWCTSVGEKGRTLGKPYEINLRITNVQ